MASPAAISCILAFAAYATKSNGDEEIVSFVGMPLRAVGFDGIIPASVSAQDVLMMRDQFDMLRVNTTTIAAEVVTLQIRRDGANKGFVGNYMRNSQLAVNPKSAVAALVLTSSPLPAAVI